MAEPAVNRYLRMVRDHKGSDLHLCSGMPPKIRVHGRLRALKQNPMTNDQVEDLLLEVLDERRRTIFREKNDLDWAYALPGVARFRCSYFRQIHGMGGGFGVSGGGVVPVEALGVRLHTERFCKMRNGLVLLEAHL